MDSQRTLSELLGTGEEHVRSEIDSFEGFNSIPNLAVHLEMHPDKQFVINQVKEFMLMNSEYFEEVKEERGAGAYESPALIRLLQSTERLMRVCIGMMYLGQIEDKDGFTLRNIVDENLVVIRKLIPLPEIDPKFYKTLRDFLEIGQSSYFEYMSHRQEQYIKTKRRKIAENL